MIRGVVNADHEVVLSLRVRGPSGTEQGLFVIVDTGYSGTLSLPPATAAALGLPQRHQGTAVLADGSERQFPVYAAEVEWDGAWVPVVVSGLGDEPLVGMTFLAGHRLTVDVEPGGSVEVRPL